MRRYRYYVCVFLLIVSLIFRLPLVLVCGILLLLILSLTDIWSRYCLQNLYYQRKLSEKQVLFGEEVTLSLSVENAKLLPLPWLEVSDKKPHVLPIEDEQVTSRGVTTELECLFSPKWYERITRTYTVRCNTRGVHAFGPATLRSGDGFGFGTRQETLSERDFVLVYPLVVPLTSFGLPSRHPFGDRKASRRLLEDPSRVIGVRDYAYGDNLRRVHWKASARMMQLQSKVYEPSSTYTLMLFLNTAHRLDAYYSFHPELQELTICAAASVADWALDQGYAVGLYANTMMSIPDIEAHMDGQIHQDEDLRVLLAEQLHRRRIHLPPSSSQEQRKRIMQMLARVQGFFGTNIEELILGERTHLPTGSTVVVVTSSLSENLIDTLTRVRRSGHAVAVIFASDSPPPMRLSNIPIYHIGGEETWNKLIEAYQEKRDPSQLPLASLSL